MARGINKVLLVGTVSDEPLCRATHSGLSVTNITVVTNEYRRSIDGNDGQEFPEWHRVVLWGKLAELAKQCLHKGTLVYIEGKLRTRSYTDKQNQKRTITEIVADDMQALSRPNNANNPNSMYMNGNINNQMNSRRMNMGYNNYNNNNQGVYSNPHNNYNSMNNFNNMNQNMNAMGNSMGMPLGQDYYQNQMPNQMNSNIYGNNQDSQMSMGNDAYQQDNMQNAYANATNSNNDLNMEDDNVSMSPFSSEGLGSAKTIKEEENKAKDNKLVEPNLTQDDEDDGIPF